MIKTLLVATFALFFLSGCFGKNGPEEWTAYIYPDKTNTKRSMVLKEIYPTLEACQTAAKSKLNELKLDATGTFQCGLRCEYHEGMKTEICERMVK